MGFVVNVTGRRLPDSLPLTTDYARYTRFRLWFNKGALFYANYNIMLFLRLLWGNPSIIWSNDMDTLPACYYASRLLNRPLIFDSHELFSEVPELQHRPSVKKVWKKWEDRLIPKVNLGITVCHSIADVYRQQYHKAFFVLRNLPYRIPAQSVKKRKSNEINERHLIYQGALNLGRGIENMISAMQYLDNTILHIAGSGDIDHKLREMSRAQKLENKVVFHGKLSREKLQQLTLNCHLGLSLEENLGLNYYYALPNKLFAYIQSGVPVLVSDFPEMRNIVKSYQIGDTITHVTPKKLAKKIDAVLNDKKRYKIWTGNLKKAARDLCWEKEQKKLRRIMERYV